MNFSIGAIILIIWYVILVATVFRIFLRENRTPASRIAWIFVVITIPYLGVLAYFLLGEVNVGKNYNQRLDRTVRDLFKKFGGRQTGNWEKSKAYLKNPHYKNVFQYSCSLTAFQPVGGNQAKLLGGPEDIIKAIIADIDAAQISFHGIYYIWFDDHTGQNFAHALIRAAKRGVKVRVMADAMGSRKLLKSALWQEMIDAGVDARAALPLKGIFHAILSSRFDLRNHRKITVIDNKITYVGSRNIADPEFLPKKKFAPWVDIMVRIEGPVVAQNNLLFATDWMMSSDENVDEIIPSAANLAEDGGFLGIVVPDGPTLRVDAIPQLFENMFGTAQNEITITTPYFVPNEGLVDAICAAAYSGITVTLNLPKRNDSIVVGATSRSYYRELLRAGVKLYEYRSGLLHSKIATVDNQLTLIGSSNLDRRSFDLNYENNILFEDEALTLDIKARQMSYLKSSDRVLLEDVEAWPSWKRAWNNMMAMLSPIL